MPERRVVKLERLVVDGGVRDRWFIRAAARRGPWTWFDAADVPPVDAREALFELERVTGGWKVVRVVGPAPSPAATRPAIPWIRPRTLGACRAAGLCRLHAACPCGSDQRWLAPSDVCRAFDDWTIEALQRAGYWRCPCGKAAAIALFLWIDGERRRVERWTLGEDPLGET